MLVVWEGSMETPRNPVPRDNLFKVIAGDLPDPRRRPPGCIFQARCDVVMPECATIVPDDRAVEGNRSEEHTSELPSLMRISYAVFCLKKTKSRQKKRTHD